MKTITYKEFVKLRPCWLEDEDGKARLKRYAQKRVNWSAIDILKLDRVSYDDRIWAVAKADLISKRVWVLWSCECVKTALALIKNPDERSIKAIEATWLYLDGKITFDELMAASEAARAASAAAWAAASEAAAWAASAAGIWATARAAAWAAAEKKQIAALIRLIETED